MEEPIRILHVVSSMNLGGIQVLLMNIFRNIDRNNVQFDFVLHTSEKCVFTDEIERLGGRIFNAPKLNGKNILRYISFWNRFYDEHSEYRIVHGHIRTTAAIYFGIAKKRKLITIAHSHSTFVEPGITGVIKKVLEYPIRMIADYFFSCSQEAAIVLFGKRIAEKTTIVKNAIDVSHFAFSYEERIKFRKLFSINETCKVAGTVGRIVTPKNPFLILDIIEECIKQVDNFRFIWVGEGDLSQKVLNEAKKKSIDQYIVFTGGLSNPESALSAMDCFILPSIDEGFGISAIEAQANGLPVLLSNKVPKSVLVMPNAEICDLNQPAIEWSRKILEMCNNERLSDITPIKNAGYDIQVTAQKLQTIYFSIAKGTEQ